MIQIRLPNITGKTPEEQLKQIQSYLFQLVGELNWALSAMENVDSTAANSSTSNVQGRK